MNQRKQEIIKKIGIGVIICAASVLTFKFLMWNYWKVERTATLAKKILRAPAAVNLTLSNRGGVLFQKSFVYNPDGNYYIVNHFDIAPYIDQANRLTLNLGINRRQSVSAAVHRFETFNLLHCTGFDADIYFAFTTGDCDMEEFVRLIRLLPSIINSLKTQK
jgi:hypothetical protein